MLYLDTDPALVQMMADGESAVDVAFQIWTSQIRYLGVGAMLTGGVWALISMRGSLVSGIRSGLHQMSKSRDERSSNLQLRRERRLRCHD